MDLEAARVLAGDLLRRHPELSDWRVTFSRRSRRTLGLCRHRHKVIQLSVPFVRLNDAGEVRDVTLHEVAHALVGPGHGHGEAWKAMARRVSTPYAGLRAKKMIGKDLEVGHLFRDATAFLFKALLRVPCDMSQKDHRAGGSPWRPGNSCSWTVSRARAQ